MSRTSRLADRYRQQYPDVEVSEAQAAERQERMDRKRDTATHRRTHRTTGIVVPDLPWMTKKGRA